ncbi:MAG: hypothetical protein OHK0046_44580 [Anaerolineae bacterium]
MQPVRRVLLITLFLNLTVAVSKITIGTLTGALAITADGFHSLVDGTSNVIGLVGNYMASLPPDEDHPYGHHRFETLAALLIGAFLMLVAWEIIQGALERLQGGEVLTLSPLAFAVLVGTLGINIGVSTYQIREGKRLRSELLLADAANTRADVFVTLSVLISMVVIQLTGWAWVDVIAALVVVALIGHAAWRILKQTGAVLVDAAPYPPEHLEALVRDVPNVTQVVRVRSRGPQEAAHIDIDVQVTPSMTAEHTAAITETIRERLNTALRGVSEVEVHFVPDADPDYVAAVRTTADMLGLSAHEVYLLESDERRVLELHVEVPDAAQTAQTLQAAHEVVSHFEETLRTRLTDIDEIVTHIEPAPPQQSVTINGQGERSTLRTSVMSLLKARYPRVDWHQLEIYDRQEGKTLTIHAALAPEATLEFAHHVAESAETLLRARWPQLQRVTIHTEPYEEG